MANAGESLCVANAGESLCVANAGENCGQMSGGVLLCCVSCLMRGSRNVIRTLKIGKKH